MIARLARAAGAALALSLSLAAFAQADYPTRTITMIVPFPPGGVADITGRPVAEAMGRHLKQTVIVENKAGAGGGVGMQYVARAKPDGYTVLMALSSVSIIPEADKILGRSPMYQLDQLVPIARFTADPTVLAVRADSPWKSVKDMLEVARSAPGTIPYGSSGNYGTMHVPMEMLAAAGGAKMLHVPFTGAGPPSWRFWAAAWTRSRRAPRRSWATSRAARCACWRAGARRATRRCPTCRRSRSWATTRSSRSGPGSSCRPARRSP